MYKFFEAKYRVGYLSNDAAKSLSGMFGSWERGSVAGSCRKIGVKTKNKIEEDIGQLCFVEGPKYHTINKVNFDCKVVTNSNVLNQILVG